MKRNNRRHRRVRRYLILIAAIVVLTGLICFAVKGLFSLWHQYKADQEPAEEAAAYMTGDTPEDAAAQDFSDLTGGTEASGDAFAGESAQAAGDGESAQTAGDGESAQTTGAGESAQTAGDGESAQTAGAGESAQTAGDGESAQTAGIGESTQTAGTGAPEAPVYDHAGTELEKGKEYLSSLDKRTPMEMEAMIEEARARYAEKLRKAAYAAKREAYRETLDESTVWDSMEEGAFLGDSRVLGFSVYGFLPSGRVLAHEGDTILAIDDDLDALKALSPRYIFISYGINDVNVGIWPTAKEYADAYAEKLEILQQALPDAEIYVNSILPATEAAVAASPVWEKLPEYSEAVSRMCADKQISFIDNDALAREHKELFAGDGIHLEPSFYRYWAENQLLGIYDRANGELHFTE